MPKVIADSSCLIALDNVQMLSILRDLYKKVYITAGVSQEYGKSIENWIEVKQVKDKVTVQAVDGSFSMSMLNAH